MPIGNKNRNNDSNKKMLFVNTRTKDEDDKDIKPYFSFLESTGEANGKKTYGEIAKDPSFSGSIVKVEAYEREIKSKGVKQPRVKIIFEDDDTAYYLDMSYTILSRSFFNCLLSLDSLEDISVNIYQTKPNDKGKVYPQISVWQNDKMVRWLYTKDELPVIKKVKVKGQEMSDTEDVDNFFRDKLNAKFSNTSSSKSSVKNDDDSKDSVKKVKTKSVVTSPENDEDIPF
jgi:hypothetical protein